MHEIQRAILDVMSKRDISSMTLRGIAEIIGKKISAQQVKHHLQQLERKELIIIDLTTKQIRFARQGPIKNSNLISIPIYGTANCGPALDIAEQRAIGYLRISGSLLNRKSTDGLFILKTNGPSMNKALVDGNNIEDGDYLVIDGNYKEPKDSDVVLSIIDGCANIKRFKKQNNNIALISESTIDFPPIYIHEEDDFIVNGKVIQVIKKP